jgi:predicted CxxxxCH...CXXCH cytochrome family protein
MWKDLLLVMVASSLACSKAAPRAVQGDVCTHCHSSPSSPLPFLNPHGISDPTAPGAGAHAAHLGGGSLRAALSCGDCHTVPASPSDPGHYGTGHAAVKFGALGRSGGLQPSWDRTTGRCSSTWCHGGGLKNATPSSPAWTEAGKLRCDSCHGAPPAAPHPQRTDCNTCHGGTVRPDGTIDLEGGLHIDGIVQAPTAGCTTCHGDPTRATFSAAPPSGTRGEKDTTAIAVGAHQSHLQAGKLRGSVPCSECHVVPTDLSHIDGTASVTFGELARSAGARPAWDRASASCSASYCHGATLPGGTNTAPKWTQVDGTQAACGSCHGVPPPAPHPQNPSCNSCHPGTVNADGSINASGGLHINGVVDVAGGSCTSCHGSGSDPAPPLGTRGETATTDRAVGAHQSHLKAGPFSRALACSECHVVPAKAPHADGKVDLSFGPLATTGGAAPQFNGSSCSAAYCHGNFTGGNAANAPLWTRVDGTQAACGTCHGLPPSNHSSSSTNCGSCHDGYTSTSVNLALHVNGKVDVLGLSCTSCHGDTARNDAAPPAGTHGETATTARAVGAHQSHLGAGPLSSGIACTECHVVPTSTSHSDGTVKLTFGPIATTGGAAPQFNGSSCSASYCHGNFNGGVAGNAPQWTRVDGTQAACGTCHGLPPSNHSPSSTNCGSCHDGYTSTKVNLGLHVNGKVDVLALTCTSCHGDPSRTNAAPPVGTHGETATTARAVGAHQSHLGSGPLRNGIACSECHVVPTGSTHSDGIVKLTFGPVATAGGVAPQFNGTSCSASYCHGNFPGGIVTNAPQWTKVDGTQAACGTCHAQQPSSGHHDTHRGEGIPCSRCHTGYSGTSINPSLHVNGRKDVDPGTGWNPSTRSCANSCHGTEHW